MCCKVNGQKDMQALTSLGAGQDRNEEVHVLSSSAMLQATPKRGAALPALGVVLPTAATR